MNSRGPLAAAPSHRRYLVFALKLAVLVAILVGARHIGDWAIQGISEPLVPSNEPFLHRMVMTAAALYVLLMMLPFVPGIEIGLALMALFGARIVPLVYGATVLALCLSFIVGRLVPQATIVEALRLLRLHRASALLEGLAPLGAQQRLEFLLERGPARAVPYLLRHRYLALAVALNLPGNALVGGGGGICLAAGFVRLFTLPRFLLTVAVAVSPLPIFVMLTGSRIGT
jgi:hypothetical protein